MVKRYSDVVVVGAGIFGLAHAYHAARAGLSVSVIERDSNAMGASVKNFGMLAVATQSEGLQQSRSRRSLSFWQEIAPLVGLELKQSGCLYLAREPEEATVLAEYVESHTSGTGNCKLLPPSALKAYAPGLRSESVINALWCADVWKVDQRQAVAKIAQWLQESFDVSMYFSTEVTDLSTGTVMTSAGSFECAKTIVCSGSDFERLFPASFAESGVQHCKLQMLRTPPQPEQWQLAPFVLGGLSLSRYSAFNQCASMNDLKAMQQQKYARYLTHGIHVIAGQESDGSITIGDSHCYGHNLPNERSAEIDRLLLEELSEMITLPTTSIAQRWTGVYPYLSGMDMLCFSPQDNITVATMTHGLGMTQGFALAEENIQSLL